MPTLKIFRETALPGTLQANAIYLIAPPAAPDYVEMYVTGNSAATVKRVLNAADIQAMIDASIVGANSMQIVADIAARNAIGATAPVYVYVQNATGDPTVVSGAATYLWNPAGSTWLKVSEAESMDLAVTWAALSGKPTSSPAQIDAAVAAGHSHANLTQLGKVGEDIGGNFTYNGALPHIGLDSSGW